MSELILTGFLETILMTGLSSAIGLFFGGPLAVLLFMTGKEGLSQNNTYYQALGILINSTRSIPYIILTILLIPVTRLLTGSSIGTLSAVIPLGVSAILLTARIVEEALKTIPRGYSDLGIALGATKKQIILKIIIPEALPNIISGITLVVINLIGFSAMAGAVGGGGLGDLAIRYGYQRYNLFILVCVVLILIFLVQFIQTVGDKLANHFKKS